jgi:hypothetical protein
MNAKYFLDKTLRLLFNPEASEQAMKNGQPAPAVTGKEQQFTPGVMARLFPKPIVSPEYTADAVTFRMKAPEAQQVLFESELSQQPLPMEKDADGVWSVTIKEWADKTFKYCFVVDGTQVADPSNMWLSPDKGFKYSIASYPSDRYNITMMKGVEHGKVIYDYNLMVSVYLPTILRPGSQLPLVRLVPGKNDTWESWFKVGGANAIADKLISEGKAKPCILIVGLDDNAPVAATLRADDYKTWMERRAALAQLLHQVK